MALAEQHHAVQALGLRGPDKPFRKFVQILTPRRQAQGPAGAVSQQSPKGRGLQRIAIEDDVRHAAQETGVSCVLATARVHGVRTTG
jgi:hypothetical protein